MGLMGEVNLGKCHQFPECPFVRRTLVSISHGRKDVEFADPAAHAARSIMQVGHVHEAVWSTVVDCDLTTCGPIHSFRLRDLKTYLPIMARSIS